MSEKKKYKKGTVTMDDYGMTYIYLQDSTDIKKPLLTKNISNDVVVDFDVDGNVYGIELFISLNIEE